MLNKKEKNQKKQSENRKYKTLIKNQFKKVKSYQAEKKTDPSEINSLIIETQKLLDKASSKGKIHRNKAARKKSQLMKLFKNIEVRDKGAIIEE